jgi:hypothetical protein
MDVHGHRVKLFGLIPKEIYPYKVQFRSIRTHVFTRKPLTTEGRRLPFGEAESEIFQALSAGRCFVVNFRVGDGKGFRFWAESDGKPYSMGGRLRAKNTTSFHVRSPLPGMIRLLRDGREVAQVRGQQLDHQSAEPGVYRVEVFRKSRGWIYSNPIVTVKA